MVLKKRGLTLSVHHQLHRDSTWQQSVETQHHSKRLATAIDRLHATEAVDRVTLAQMIKKGVAPAIINRVGGKNKRYTLVNGYKCCGDNCTGVLAYKETAAREFTRVQIHKEYFTRKRQKGSR